MKDLFVCATELEMAPLRKKLAGRDDVELLVSGVGLVESACSLSCFLAAGQGKIRTIINFGIAGAYVGGNAGLLDICLAEKEVLGDLGLCFKDHIEPLGQENITVRNSFPLANPVLRQVEKIFNEKSIEFQKGTFVTVNCVSASALRGDFLGRTHQALAENMEGAAIARACLHFDLPLVELRCISNMVEDRDTSSWRLNEACEKSAITAACLAGNLFT